MYVIGVAGGSGSGKTTFANKILGRVNDPNVTLLHQDNYYLPSPPPDLKIHGEPNFDHPNAFDWPLLRDHLERLKRGEQVAVPTYDYKISRRTQETLLVGPCKVILLEGIFTLWDPALRGIFDLKIYLHVDSDIRFIRRLHRDSRERGRTLDSIIRQYYDSVRPMHQMFLEPTSQYADITVGEETDMAAEVIAARISQILTQERNHDSNEEIFV